MSQLSAEKIDPIYNSNNNFTTQKVFGANVLLCIHCEGHGQKIDFLRLKSERKYSIVSALGWLFVTSKGKIVFLFNSKPHRDIDYLGRSVN